MKRTNTATWMEKQKRWQIKVQKDGERRSFYSSKPGRTGQREANAKADAWLDDGIEGTRKRVAELFDEYVEELKQNTSESNWHKIESYGRVWLKPVIGHKKIENISEDDFQKIINAMHKKGLSKKTIQCFRATVCQFCKYCRRVKVSTLNPEFLEIPRGAYSKKKGILQPEHLSVLFSVSTTLEHNKKVEDKLIHAYRFQVLTGLRPGELMGLKWGDVWDNVVHIQRSINYLGEETTGKNKNAIRNFALTPSAKAELEQQQKLTKSKEGFVFPVGTYKSAQHEYYRCWLRYCKANDLPNITPYEIRHTFVSLAKNLPEGRIKPLVGHSKNMDTLGTYAHEMKDDMERTAASLEQVFLDIFKSGL